VSAVYLVLAVPAGLAFALLIPPSQVLDESAHFLRVWQVAEGNVIAERRTDPNSGLEVNGGSVDLCVREYVDEFAAAAALPAPYRFRDFWLDTPDCTPQRREYFMGEAMGSYSIWTYPGHTVGVAVGRATGLPVPVTFFLGRLLGLAFAISLAWQAIRTAPRAKLVMCAVALLPMSLMGAAGYSPDGLVLGTSLILVAYCLRFATTDAVMRRLDIAIIAAALIALTMTKPPYVVFALLFLCYRATAGGTKKQTTRTLGVITLAAVVLTAAWNRLGFPQGAVETFRPHIDQAAQLRWIVTHPLAYLNVVSDTFFYWESQEFVIKGWVGAFGMFRSGVADSPLIMPIFVLLAAAAIAVFSAVEAGPLPTLRSRAVALQSWVPWLTIAAGVLAIFTSAYVAWDEVGAPRIYGLQGRYFIPLLPLPALALALRHEPSRSAIGTRGVVCVAAVLLTAAFFKVGLYFY
jgi:uncharacterized membrane protein